ncbi:hypothetical protein [Nonomuraea angiospora]
MAGKPIYWTWIAVVRRAELGFGEGKRRINSSTVQHVALVAATYGNPDGTRVRPSAERLARVTRLNERTVRLCLARLRDVGLLVRVMQGSSQGRRALADEYRLAIPDDLLERVAMLDPNERDLTVPEGVEPPPPKRTRSPRSPGDASGDGPVDNS